MTTPPTPPTDNLAAEGGPRSEMSEREVEFVYAWAPGTPVGRRAMADALADLLAARDRRVRNVAEDIAYEHAATIDGEFGCCHDEAELRAGGRAPAFDGDEFDPLPEDCDGKRILDRHLATIHAASEADA